MPSTRSWRDIKRDLEGRRNAEGLTGAWFRSVDVYRRWRNKVAEAPRTVKWAYQRVARGWDDRAVWSLDTRLASTLGPQLVKLSEIAHGYPGDHYPYDQWTADLKKHGEALIDYSQAWVDEWESTGQTAQEALRWVADNLGSLWD